MKNVMSRLIMLIMIALIAMPTPGLAQSLAQAPAATDPLEEFIASQPLYTAPAAPSATTLAAPADVITITLYHTNDFHGQLEASGSNPGLARVADVISTTFDAPTTLILDGGDEMQGSLLSNLQKGKPTIAAFNTFGTDAATFGNHEFDWGQTVLASRTSEAAYPFLSANIVTNNTGDCTTAGWTKPAFVSAPYVIKTLTDGTHSVDVGILGVTTQETPNITLASNTDGLCFKDPAASITHYYDEMKTAGADVFVVLSHLGYADGGSGYGFNVYGDQTLAQKLIDAGKPVNLIIGGHSHTNMATANAGVAKVIGNTSIVSAYYNGRQVGRAYLGYDTVTGAVNIRWTYLPVSTTRGKNAAVDAVINSYASDPAYMTLKNQVIGYTNQALTRNIVGTSPKPSVMQDNLVADLVDDSIYNYLNTTSSTTDDIDMFFNNAGGIRSDITSPTATYPYTLTYGDLFLILPFGNQTIVGTMTGAQVLDVLNQGALLSASNGPLQAAGLHYKYYRYAKPYQGTGNDVVWAWGAYDVQVYNKTKAAWEALDVNKTYSVGTNEFLAPAGGDGYNGFKYMKNIFYYGDMLDAVNAYIAATYGTKATAYKGPNGDGTLDGRIVRNGDDASGTIVPVTILHHNDSHGNLLPSTSGSSSYPGYTQLATKVGYERWFNPDNTLLMSAGDSIQGDAMMYYYRTAPLGYDAEGVALPSELITHPLIAAFNSMNYDAYTLGNHEFNFGSAVFKGIMKQAKFPILQANIADSGAYGLTEANVKPYVEKTLASGVKVAILGIGNHRIPNYELPSNIPGLTFNNPITVAQSLAPNLKANNDLVIALTHIGFTTNPSSVEVDTNVDTYLASQVDGIDTIIGGHSHTDPKTGFGDYKWLPTFVASPDKTPVLITQAYRYNNRLGEVVIGMLPNEAGGYTVASRTGRYFEILASATEDAAVKAVITPYKTYFDTYNSQSVGKTTTPIDTQKAFTQETNGANLQADASVWELAQHGINVDFHISGAMTNKLVAPTATQASPVSMTIADMFAAMPYENSLVTMKMNGPQLKAVLERAYRNYYYYKYVTGYGGYSYYTTCMLDINKLGQISYNDTYPALPDGNNVISMVFNGDKHVNFSDASTYYHVSTVNYLAAGSCNFNDNGVSLWPLNQIVSDTQYYVRDAVIHYMKAQGTVSPAIEGRLQFTLPTNTAAVPTAGTTQTYVATNGDPITFVVPSGTFNQSITLAYTKLDEPDLGGFHFGGVAFNLIAYGADNKVITSLYRPITVQFSYTDEDIAGIDESSLLLKYWNGTGWVDASCGAYTRFPTLNYISVPICHLSKFALTGSGQYFLPSILK